MGSARLLASGPTFWTVATAADFLEGRSDGVYVSLSGTVAAGPELTSRLSSTPAQIWSLAQAADGTLWAGTGGDGRLIRVRPGQSEETVFDAEENNIFAIAIGGNRVYAASSPDGKVYVIDGSGPARVLFDPAEKYIWALAVDGDGQLWVGAGNPAVIYRVAADGSNQVVYRPSAAHVVSLALDGSGRMLAGTESPGRLYRFDAENRPFVVLDSGMTELRAISAGPDGTIFAAALAKSDAPAEGGETTSVAVTLAPAAPSSSSDSSSSSTTSNEQSVLYRIAENGTWEKIWSTADLVYDLAAQQDGSVLVATGPEGRLYGVAADRDVRLLTGVDAKQITRFATGTRLAPLGAFATANPGRVMAVGTGVQSPAHFVSPVRDTQSVATWGLIRWEATGAVSLATRSGNTARPDDSWSDWSDPYTLAEGELVTSPPARFIQWRAEFTSASRTEPAQLRAVTLAYLPRNNRPEVTSITVHPPGVVFQRPYVNDESAIAGLDDAVAESRRPPGDTPRPAPAPGRRMFQKGLQTIAWKADDADDDTLAFTLHYRREGETEWRELRSGLSDSIYVWDTTTVADGRYVVRVEASDASDNVGDRALTGTRDSEAIEVDNTPPALTIGTTLDANRLLDVHVVDGRSPIAKVEYSIGGGSWKLVYPVDGLADAPDERYQIPVPANVSLDRIVIRATDLLQNVVSEPAAR